MRRRIIILILSLTLFLFTCVPAYQRYIEGTYTGSSSSDLFIVLDELVKEDQFIFLRTWEKPLRYTMIADYERYDDSIQKKIYLIIFLKDVDEVKGQTEFLITVNGPGDEKPIKRAVDKAFETLVFEIESRLEPSKLKILKKS
jgi:hypothetical protein